MGLPITTQTAYGRNRRDSSSVIKLHATSPAKPKFKLRSTNKHFWYTAPDGIIRLATNSDTGIIPEQTNTYGFDASPFEHEPFPFSLPPGNVWPPQRVEDVVCAEGEWDKGCVGDRCYTNKMCDDPFCYHTFENWRKATADWEEHVELRMTDARGIGVFTKHAFRKGDVLGWYAGELKTLDNCGDGDYLMEMEIGTFASGWDSDSDADADADEAPCATIYIDSQKKGNWTRFINHSCNPYALFRMRRVGGVRLMTVEAIRDVPAGDELTVSYGNEYYGLKTLKVCCCGTKSCVGKKRQRRDEAREEHGRKKVKVKKCRRVGPP